MSRLSVVLIGKDEQGRIGRAIDSARRQLALEGFSDAPIIYVDSRSTDRSVAEAIEHGARVLRLGPRCFISPPAGRMAGLLNTDSEYVLHIDGDVVLLGGWIAQAVAYMDANPKVACVGGRVVRVAELASALADVEKRPAEDPGPPRDCPYIMGAAGLYRRSAVINAGNWNPYVCSNEEFELALRLHKRGYKVTATDRVIGMTEAMVFTSPWREVLRRFKRGFWKGPGQVLRLGIKYGYFWPFLRHPRVFGPILVGLWPVMLAALLVIWPRWWFVWAGLVAVGLLAVAVHRKRGLSRAAAAVVHLTLIGWFTVFYFFASKPRTASDFDCDWQWITG